MLPPGVMVVKGWGGQTGGKYKKKILFSFKFRKNEIICESLGYSDEMRGWHWMWLSGGAN